MRKIRDNALIYYSVIVNMFIAIIEDGFIATQYKSRFDWLKRGRGLDDPPPENPKQPLPSEKSPIDKNESMSMYRKQSNDGSITPNNLTNRNMSMGSKQGE